DRYDRLARPQPAVERPGKRHRRRQHDADSRAVRRPADLPAEHVGQANQIGRRQLASRVADNDARRVLVGGGKEVFDEHARLGSLSPGCRDPKAMGGLRKWRWPHPSVRPSKSFERKKERKNEGRGLFDVIAGHRALLAALRPGAVYAERLTDARE